MTLDEVLREVAKRKGDLDKDIYHYLMMYRYLLRKQGEAEERKRRGITVTVGEFPWKKKDEVQS